MTKSLARIKVEIIGTTPLLMDRFPDKAKEEILMKDFGMSRTKKDRLRNKEAEMEEAIHYTKDKKYCFPATAFEKGMMTVAPYAGNKKFTIKLVGCAISIKGNLIDQDGAPCVPITSKKGFKEFKHWVRHNVKFSPLFEDWKTELIIEYPPDMITADDIVTCLDLAGSMVGIGGWRPRCTDGGKGIYGQYKVLSCDNA